MGSQVTLPAEFTKLGSGKAEIFNLYVTFMYKAGDIYGRRVTWGRGAGMGGLTLPPLGWAGDRAALTGISDMGISSGPSFPKQPQTDPFPSSM